MAAMMTVADPGDKVIVFSPFYENYGADTILSGAEPIYVPLHPPEFSFDPNELEDAFRQNPKALILCNPSNPCGKVFTRQELETIAQLAVKYDTYVITDEVYEHIVYAPNVHTYFATLPGMWERTISCSSLSKTYSITGWRLGYIIAPPEIIDVAKKVHDFLTVGAAAPLQEAAVTGLRFGPEYYKWLQRQIHRQSAICSCKVCATSESPTPSRRARIMSCSTFRNSALIPTWSSARCWRATSAWARCRAPASSANRSTT